MSKDRKDYTQQIYSGIRFDVHKPDPKAILIDDIAISLSKICRYNGHCDGFYSVAEHSVLVAKHIEHWQNTKDPEIILWGLMHDAAEAYIGDMAAPIKYTMPKFKTLEKKVMKAVIKRFDLQPEDEPPPVDQADWAIGALEYQLIMKPALPGHEWFLPYKAPRENGIFTIRNLTWTDSYLLFMKTFNDIMKRREKARDKKLK